jgi:uncharacterized protein YqjF (DUF2071 family)
MPPISEREWRPALSMRWKHLLFVHWRVPAASLRPLIPEPLQWTPTTARRGSALCRS